MIKLILFDCDGLIIKHEKYFTVRLAAERGVVLEDENAKQKEFFKGVFIDCETGKADLKEELQKDLGLWSWSSSVEELMEYWFSGEATVEKEMKDFVLGLRQKGFKCFLCTNNEKYRTEYLQNVVGLKNIFDGLFSSASIGYLKKQQEFWQEVYKNFDGIEKQNVLVCDDDMPNVEAASKFGFNAEFYTNFESFKKVMSEKYNINA